MCFRRESLAKWKRQEAREVKHFVRNRVLPVRLELGLEVERLDLKLELIEAQVICACWG